VRAAAASDEGADDAASNSLADLRDAVQVRERALTARVCVTVVCRRAVCAQIRDPDSGETCDEFTTNLLKWKAEPANVDALHKLTTKMKIVRGKGGGNASRVVCA
jgi:hypothetical protein